MDHTLSRVVLVAAPSPPAQEQAACDSALFQAVAFFFITIFIIEKPHSEIDVLHLVVPSLLLAYNFALALKKPSLLVATLQSATLYSYDGLQNTKCQ
jgi:hypothetical protein